jgi:hypothetical protein
MSQDLGFESVQLLQFVTTLIELIKQQLDLGFGETIRHAGTFFRSVNVIHGAVAFRFFA